MKAAEWIDRLRAERNWPSDYRVAKELGVPENSISNYRGKPGMTLGEEMGFKVAEALGVKPEIVLLDQLAERAKDQRARDLLRALLARVMRGPKGGKGSGGAAAGADGGSGGPPALNVTSAASTPAPGRSGPRNALGCAFARRYIHRMK
jgi:hypothetical protein